MMVKLLCEVGFEDVVGGLLVWVTEDVSVYMVGVVVVI